MNLLEKLCKELGVEVGEVWMGNDGKYYYIDGRGHLINRTKEGYTYTNWIERVLIGKLRPVWEPKKGETYYVPSVSMSDKYIDLIWTNSPGDEKNYKRGIAFRTKEEAINMTEKILDFIKEER